MDAVELFHFSNQNRSLRNVIPSFGFRYTDATLDVSTYGAFLADPQGIWLQGGDGIYLWRAGSGLTLVSTSTATPVGTCA